jgi:hypothetical protein
MAKQVGLLKFTGRVGNVIGYRRKGVYCVRTMPETVRQTAATRRAARSFGVASRRGRLIRRALCPYMDTRHDGSFVNRLNKELILAGSHNLQALKGFRFNKHNAVGNLFLVPPMLTPDGRVHIPDQEFGELELGKATRLEITVIAARINFSEQRVVNANAVTEVINLTMPFDGITFDVPAPGKGTLILAIQARTCDERNGAPSPVGGRRFMAADIISIAPPYELIQKEKESIGKRSSLIPSSWRARREPAGLPPGTTWSSSPSLRRPEGLCGEPGRSNLLPPVFTCKLE